jgi:hypothetical protein
MRNGMEGMRPPGVTELLLTNDGDHILEGSVTNFFVVCLKVNPYATSLMTKIRNTFCVLMKSFTNYYRFIYKDKKW